MVDPWALNLGVASMLVIIFTIIFLALAEARDIDLHLKPLTKPLNNLENTTEFSDIMPQLKPLVHVVCLIWANSKYYCQTTKIVVLLKRICNLLIEKVVYTFSFCLLSLNCMNKKYKVILFYTAFLEDRYLLLTGVSLVFSAMGIF